MGEKKKIKGIKDSTGSGQNAMITAGDAGPIKAGVAAVPDITFDQPGYKALCFNVDDVINTDSIVIPGTTTAVVVTARRIQRGTVTTVNGTNDGGTIAENKTAKSITFSQFYCKEMGIITGAEVKYDLVYDFKTNGEVGVNIEILP